MFITLSKTQQSVTKKAIGFTLFTIILITFYFAVKLTQIDLLPYFSSIFLRSKV